MIFAYFIRKIMNFYNFIKKYFNLILFKKIIFTNWSVKITNLFNKIYFYKFNFELNLFNKIMNLLSVRVKFWWNSSKRGSCHSYWLWPLYHIEWQANFCPLQLIVRWSSLKCGSCHSYWPWPLYHIKVEWQANLYPLQLIIRWTSLKCGSCHSC